jgi:hypothetical protein
MSPRTAACACGQLRLRCEGDPVRVSVCHCFACQRRTGSAFGAQARFSEAQIIGHEGHAQTWTRVGDSGGQVTFHFCPVCGTTVWWELDGLPGYVAVALGTFADPGYPPPVISIYEARQHPWALDPGLDIAHMD